METMLLARSQISVPVPLMYLSLEHKACFFDTVSRAYFALYETLHEVQNF
jgi:hypothetical protein